MTKFLSLLFVFWVSENIQFAPSPSLVTYLPSLLVVDHAAPHSDTRGNGKTVAVAVVISVFLTTVLIIVFIGGYKYWQKRKRRQEQARFLKLFEEKDDIEDELGLRDII